MDVFATEKQTEQARRAIFNATTSEILLSLQTISSDYSEKDFNEKLYERMDQYGEFIREPNTVFAIPGDFKISKLLWVNLTNILAKKVSLRTEISKLKFYLWRMGSLVKNLKEN